MNHELLVFFGSAGLVVIGGGLVRWLALPHEDAFTLALLDFSRDLFGAAAAVFPTTLIVKSNATWSNSEVASTLLLIVVIALWAQGDSRYFSYWRKGQKRSKQAGGKLGDPEAASSPKRYRLIAFSVGNGLGFMVLYASTVLSHHITS